MTTDGPAWTPRERQVLDLIAAGRTNPEIADELGISWTTAKWHVSELITKLGVASREEVAEYWRAERRWSPGRLMVPLAWPGGPRLVIAALSVAVVFVATVAVAAHRTPRPGAVALLADAATAAGSCNVDSSLPPPGFVAECLAGLDVARTRVSSVAPTAPVVPDGRLVLVALLHYGSERLLYLRYETPGGSLEWVAGRFDIDWAAWERALRAIVNSADPSRPPPWAASRSEPGGPTLLWCPRTPDGGFELSGRAPCPGDETVIARGLPETDLVVIATATHNGQWDLKVSEGIPLLPFRGGRVAPAATDIPSLPGAVEVDGFMKLTRGSGPERLAPVQAFATEQFPDQVLSFYERELAALGWMSYHGGGGLAGRAVAYHRERTGEWVIVSTAYVAHPEDEPRDPPPGFRGKGVPFQDRWHGKSYFWVLTWTE